MNLGTQLRAILLIVGVVVLITIYWLGRRKSSAAYRRNVAPTIEPAMPASSVEYDEDPEADSHVMYDEPVHASHSYRRQATADRVGFATSLEDETPPAVDLPPMYAEPKQVDEPITAPLQDESEHTLSDFSVADSRREPVIAGDDINHDDDMEQERSVRGESAADPSGASPLSAEPSLKAVEPQVPTMDETMETAPHRARKPSAPVGDTAPTLSDAIAKQDGRRYESPVSRPKPAAAATSKPASRKIIALRLAAGNERISGERLLALFADEDLQHGKFSIFHRMYNGATLFSVASMVEPGSFDLNAMGGQQFPGITMFALLPAPIESVKVFDLMLECAQNLANGMNAVLQDERGVKLMPQGIERMREDVLNFQHLMG